MADFTANKILHGTEGRAYFDNERIANVQQIDVKIDNNTDDLNINGNYVAQPRYTGSTISGTVTLHKFDSYALKAYQNVTASGVVPDIALDVIVSEPQSAEKQHVRLSGIVFTSIDLGSFKNGELMEEELPFKAGGYTVIEVI